MQSKKIKIFLIIVLIFAIFFIGVYSYIKIYNVKNLNFPFLNKMFSSNKKDLVKSKEILNYDINTNSEFGVSQESIIQCSNNKIMFLSKDGKLEMSFSVGINNPLIKCEGKYTLVADIGGKDVVLYKGKAKEWEKRLESNIVNTDLNQNGYASIVHEQKGYKGSVTYFNPQGKEQFNTSKAEHFILSAKVSLNGKQVLLDTLDTSGVKINTIFEFVDSMGKLLDSSIPKEDTIFTNAWFLEDNSMVAIGDKCIIYYDKNRKISWQKNINTNLYSADILNDKYIVIAKGKDTNSNLINKKNSIVCYNYKGAIIFTYDIADDIKNIETYSDMIAINTGREIYFINSKGKLIENYPSKKEIKAIKFISKHECIVVSNNNVVLLNF